MWSASIHRRAWARHAAEEAARAAAMPSAEPNTVEQKCIADALAVPWERYCAHAAAGVQASPASLLSFPKPLSLRFYRRDASAKPLTLDSTFENELFFRAGPLFKKIADGEAAPVYEAGAFELPTDLVRLVAELRWFRVVVALVRDRGRLEVEIVTHRQGRHWRAWTFTA